MGQAQSGIQTVIQASAKSKLPHPPKSSNDSLKQTPKPQLTVKKSSVVPVKNEVQSSMDASHKNAINNEINNH